jgi:hypothetical protein
MLVYRFTQLWSSVINRSTLVALAKVKSDKALTDSVDALDARIVAAEKALGEVDLREATKEVDPQVASMASAINADRNVISLISLAVLAIAIEMGSGLGVWFVFGHAPRRKEKAPKMVPEAIVVETPAKARERFFAASLVQKRGKRLTSSTVYLSYAKWCAENGVTPMSPQAFGRGGHWKKEKTGGTVCYLDASMKDGWVSTPALKIVSSA